MRSKRTQKERAKSAEDWAEVELRKQESSGQLLLKCARLMDELAVARVNEAGGPGKGPKLRPSHTRLFPHIDQEGTRLTELARRVGITKQAVGQLVDELVQHGVLELVADPEDGRARRARFTPRGVQAIAHGLSVLGSIEADVSKEVGRERMRALHETLTLMLQALERLSHEEASKRS